MIVSEYYHNLTKCLKQFLSEDIQKEAQEIICQTLKWTHIEFLTNMNERLCEQDIQAINRNVRRRCRHEPLAYIFSQIEFRNTCYQVEKGVLIPRTETELLIQTVINYYHFRKEEPDWILECGFGTGVVLLELAKQFPKAKCLGWDTNKTAYKNATINQKLKSITNVEWKNEDFFKLDISEFKKITEKNKIALVSNPPYIAQSDYMELPLQIKKYEPKSALLGGKDGLQYYRKLINLCESLPIFMCLEIGINQKQALIELCKKHQKKNYKFDNDLAGIPRVLSIFP